MRILALEASTVSAKTMLYDSDTATIQKTSQRFRFPTPDSSQHDADEAVSQLFALGREFLDGRAVDLVALCGTWHGLTMQSDKGASLTPVFEWPYLGAQKISMRLRADPVFANWYYENTGAMVNAIYPSFKLRLLADSGFDLASGLAMDQCSVLFQRLTGHFATTPSLASGTGLLDVKTATWNQEIIQALGIGAVRLPGLINERVHAPLTREAGAMLGLASGTPVLAPGPDGGLSQLGDDAGEAGKMTFSMGTSGAMRLTTPTPVLSRNRSTWCYRAPDAWLSGIATNGCCNVTDWARLTLFGENVDYGALEARLRPGKRDVPTFLPFLFGERCPGWHEKRHSGFVDLQSWHDPIDLYQAVLQGIVFNLRQGYEELVRLNGEPSNIRLSGGVLASPFWTQLTADVIGARLEISPYQQSSSLGAIQLGLSALGADAGQCLGLTSRSPQYVEPDPELDAYYQERYHTYVEAYKQTTPKEMSLI